MIIIWRSGSPADNMEESLLVNLRPSILRHPWLTARAAGLGSTARQGATAVGEHSRSRLRLGTNLERLEAAGFQVTGLDVSRRALELIDRPYRQLIEADLSKDLPESAPQYDCVLALDVIEHIDDDSRALHQLARLVKPPGLVVVSVPALPLPGRRPAKRQAHSRVGPGGRTLE